MSYENLGTPTGNNLFITIPERGTKNWDESIKDGCFQKISDHDHTPGKGAAIQEAALDSALQTKVSAIATNTSNISTNTSNISSIDTRVIALETATGGAGNAQVVIAAKGPIILVQPGSAQDVGRAGTVGGGSAYNPGSLINTSTGDITLQSGQYLISLFLDISGASTGTSGSIDIKVGDVGQPQSTITSVTYQKTTTNSFISASEIFFIAGATGNNSTLNITATPSGQTNQSATFGYTIKKIAT